MLETCNGMQAHVEVFIQQTRASQAVLSLQLGPKQADALGELRLRDDRKGQWSIRINDQWRICFRWKDGIARDVEIVDYH